MESKIAQGLIDNINNWQKRKNKDIRAKEHKKPFLSEMLIFRYLKSDSI